jgi:hypothetical protein
VVFPDTAIYCHLFQSSSVVLVISPVQESAAASTTICSPRNHHVCTDESLEGTEATTTGFSHGNTAAGIVMFHTPGGCLQEQPSNRSRLLTIVPPFLTTNYFPTTDSKSGRIDSAKLEVAHFLPWLIIQRYYSALLLLKTWLHYHYLL